MAFATEGSSGELDDRVRLQLGPDDVRIFETYEVHSGIFAQPNAFETKLSAGKRLARELIEKYPPGPKTRFALSVGPFRQFTGHVDALDIHADDGSTSVTFKGRDELARLMDNDIDAERTFTNMSLEELVKTALRDVGLGNKIVEVSNLASAKVRSGLNVKIQKEPVNVDEVKRVQSGNGERVVVTAKLGESWLDFLHRHIEKQGLFIWSDAYGNVVLSRPNKFQDPLLHFWRERGQTRNICNVTRASLTNDTTHRFAEVVIFARNGGKKFGRNHIHGGFVDEEMARLGFGRRRVYRDANVSNAEEAAAYAARKIGEINRRGWRLEYTVSGHTAPKFGSVKERGIPTPDTIARVDDDELGIHEPLYIESVVFKSPPRHTVITFMRPKDIVFGDFAG